MSSILFLNIYIPESTYFNQYNKNIVDNIIIFMKLLKIVLLTTLFISVFGLAGCSGSGEPRVEETPTIPPDNLIPVSLPIRAEILLAVGKSKSGRLSKIDDETKQIEITNGGNSQSVKLAQIKKVKFKPNAEIYSRGKIVIRGKEDKSSANKQETWKGIPLSNFQLKNPQTGEAKVDLTNSGVNEAKQFGIKAVVQDSIYVAEEMEFESSNKITLKVTPVDR